MIRVQDQRDVKSMLHNIVGTLSGQRIQEVFGEGHGGVATDDVQALTKAVEGRHNRGGLRHETHCLAGVGFRRHIRCFRIVNAQHRYGSAQNVHGIGLRHVLQKIDDLSGDTPVGSEVFLELVKFSALGQPPVP